MHHRLKNLIRGSPIKVWRIRDGRRLLNEWSGQVLSGPLSRLSLIVLVLVLGVTAFAPGGLLDLSGQDGPKQPTTPIQSKPSDPAPPPATPARGAGSPGNSTKPSTDAPAAPTNTQKGITVRVEEVNVPVSVLNRRGEPVIDLSEKDFEIYEDGKRQAIKYLYRGTRPPLRIGLVLDTSNSARRKLQFEQDAASEFVFEMPQQSKPDFPADV
jgi:hypothetical protein